ncbi:hypothetical protein STCU_03864 [Strigomonas culicis]|uniref:Uncharacterized protein n=1 Tax=Strigomonas culicis TaxID=28005 RepID=S9UPX4_9TRYP|nr:hypothetical protein STCU_03864 [Strigomonas culicis]|eukprot:EPY30839.1 hypothetical protein STCU_03864 [Strigomonas culicis]
MSVASLTRTRMDALNLPQLLQRAPQALVTLVRHYWYWIIYIILLRKLYRITFSGVRKSLRSTPTTTTGTQRRDNGGPTLHVNFRDEEGTPTSSPAPATNEVIVRDDVIIVNRDNRYLEVYEKRTVERVDNVDEQVESLLREFSRRR